MTVSLIKHLACNLLHILCKSKKGGKDQESIQSSATLDQGYHMGKWQKQN